MKMILDLFAGGHSVTLYNDSHVTTFSASARVSKPLMSLEAPPPRMMTTQSKDWVMGDGCWVMGDG